MKKNQNLEHTLQLPAEIQSVCAFGDTDAIALRAAEGVCVLHKKELTVLEVGRLIEALGELAAHFSVHLAGVAGMCDGCDGLDSESPAERVAHCTLCQDLLDDSQSIHIPDYLLEEADIPVGAKLEAFVDEDSGEIIVSESEIQRDITDLPHGVLTVLAASGVCLAELDERIMLGEIVYGK